MFTLEMSGEELRDGEIQVEDERATAYVSRGDECSVRIGNSAGENGEEQEPGALTWLNSARITADPEEDAVHCVISVGDPRGGFCFTVRRLSDGHLVIHTPYPGESLPHMATKQLRPGTLEVGRYDPSMPENYGVPVDFSDPAPDENDES